MNDSALGVLSKTGFCFGLKKIHVVEVVLLAPLKLVSPPIERYSALKFCYLIQFLNFPRKDICEQESNWWAYFPNISLPVETFGALNLDVYTIK